LEPLGLELKELTAKELESISSELMEKRKGAPQMKNASTILEEVQEAWRANDEAYKDFAAIPRIVRDVMPILEIIIEEGVDETALRDAISTMYNQIINGMKERRLVEAVAEMGKSNLQARPQYKGRPITHPAGAEKVFFSLAILTALGHYFDMPIFIDEVANNLDANNLRMFFNLAGELTRETGVQYILSVKETRDFDFEGWVKELSSQIVVYELKGKAIRLREL
jgi:DNA repair exonuclease SbcCD ATPase subunit